MYIGSSLFLIAIGAILKFAVQDSINEIDLETTGVILMVVGAIGLAISLVIAASARRRTVVHREAPYDDPPRY